MTTEKNMTLQIAVPTPLRQYFDYLPPESGEWQHLQPGMRVIVPFQRRELIGIFMGFSTK
jgi:primosomal protein N' (replication factor Y)